jgi:hypothetical protein
MHSYRRIYAIVTVLAISTSISNMNTVAKITAISTSLLYCIKSCSIAMQYHHQPCKPTRECFAIKKSHYCQYSDYVLHTPPAVHSNSRLGFGGCSLGVGGGGE